MKKLLTILCLTTTLAFVVQAEDTVTPNKKREVSPELKALIEKYDANKDGKLDKEERAKMTDEDKTKMKELSPRRAKPAAKKEVEATK